MGEEGALKPSSDIPDGALAALMGCGRSGPAVKPGGGGGGGGGGGAASGALQKASVQ